MLHSGDIRILMHTRTALARLLQTKIFVTERKKQAINCIGDNKLDELLTQDPYAAQVHVIPIQDIQPDVRKMDQCFVISERFSRKKMRYRV